MLAQVATSRCTEVAATGSLLLPANTPFVDNTGVASHLKCPRLSGSVLCYGGKRKELREVAIEHLGREGERDGCLGRLGGEEAGGGNPKGIQRGQQRSFMPVELVRTMAG
jgi:hypothetical protein